MAPSDLLTNIDNDPVGQEFVHLDCRLVTINETETQPTAHPIQGFVVVLTAFPVTSE